MKSNWIPFQPANVPQTKHSEIERKIKELIDWYDDNATRKEDDYIKAKLKSVIDMAANIESSEDILFIEEIVNTLLKIIKLQRDVIRELEYESEISPINAAPQHNYVSPYVAPVENAPVNKLVEEFTDDKQIKAAFIAYMEEEHRSPYTINDYLLRIENLWKKYEFEYRSDKLKEEFSHSMIEEQISLEYPLLNVYHNIEVLNRYVARKIAEGSENNRNWTNVRASLNTFGKALYGDKYKYKKVQTDPAERAAKDFSKYRFDGQIYGKSRLVLAVVKQYVADYNPHTFEELRQAFPDELQGSFAVVCLVEDVPDKYRGIGGVKRYFDEIIRLASGERVLVSTQWGANIERFIEQAMFVLGYEIYKV